MKHKIFFCLIIFLLLVDRFFKNLSLEEFSLSSGKEFFIIPKFFKFTFFANHHLAFGLPILNLDLIIIISVLIVLGLLFYLGKSLKEKNTAVCLGLLAIVLGASSNLFDRLSYHYVIDYLRLWPISYFNLADLMIGGGILIILNSKFKITNSK